MPTATIEKSKVFFCQACLEHEEFKHQSSDPRYCNPCFKFLQKEAEHYAGIPPWKPTDKPVKRRTRKNKSINAIIERLNKTANVKNGGSDNHTDRHQTKRPSVTKPVTPPNVGKTTNKKNVTAKIPKNVTDEKIMELSAKGLKTREIAKAIGDISHMTVARRLAGQRRLL